MKIRGHTRREFTALLAGAVAGGVLANPALPLAGGVDDAYSVIGLGDTHYDRNPPTYFHAQAIARWQAAGTHKRRLLEFRRNAAMWQDLSPRILAASAKIRRPDTAFMLQVGDLVQGDCMSDSLHITMLAEAMDLLEKTYPGLPIVSVCGNHDIREGESETGAATAYRQYMLPRESHHLTTLAPDGIAQTTFGFRCGRDYWLCLDFNYGERDFDLVKRLLQENRDVRHTFVVVHGPVLPLDTGRSRWFYLGAPDSDILRREMRAVLARRKAIVIAGHAHTLEFRDWHGDGGRITEMILNTVAGNGKSIFPAEPTMKAATPADWGRWLAEGGTPKYAHARTDTAKTSVGMAALYAEYRDGLRAYQAARAVGHYCLHVDDATIRMEYYGHDALVPTNVFTLR